MILPEQKRIQQMFIKNKYNSSTVYTLTWDASAVQDHFGSYIVKGVCLHNSDNMNTWELLTEEAHYCMVFLLQQCMYCAG